MKELNGKEIADFVKERQLRVSRGLRQSGGIRPKLAIVRCTQSPVVDTYMKIKTAYGTDIEAEVDVVEVPQTDAVVAIDRLNNDQTVTGIIVQLPLENESETDKILNSVDPNKDVDGLTQESKFSAPTATAISWLLAGHNIDLQGKKIVVVGQGRLVGAPLTKMWLASGYQVEAADENTKDLTVLLKDADVIVSAVGKPGLIKNEMIKEDAVIVDAGVSAGSNGLLGDVDEDIRQREDIKITPVRGGVGPLTVAALFENLLIATAEAVKTKPSAS